MRMPDGSAPRSTSSTTRLMSVLVLPEPAGARTRAGPRACSTAARCAASSWTASGPLEGRPPRVGSAAAGRPATGLPAAGSGPAAANWAGGCPLPAADARSSRPMSSRSSRAASPTARRRGSSTSAANGRPRQKGRPRATRGWTRRRRISVACASNSSRDPFQYQSPTGTSPRQERAPGLAGVLGPRTPRGEARARGGRRRSLREVAAARDIEEQQARAAAITVGAAARRRVARGEGWSGEVGVEAHGRPTVAALARPDEGDEGGR